MKVSRIVKLDIVDNKFILDAVVDTSRTDYVFTAPGKIDQKASNADSYSGKTATWSVQGGSRTIHLESSTRDAFQFRWWYGAIIACCCLLLVVVVGVVVFFVVRRKPKQPTM